MEILKKIKDNTLFKFILLTDTEDYGDILYEYK